MVVTPEQRKANRRLGVILATVALALALSGTLSFLAGTTSLLLLLVFFTVNVSLIVIKRREHSNARTFCAPRWVPLAGALSCLGLMPFVPRSSLLTAGIIVTLGSVLVLLRGQRAGA